MNQWISTDLMLPPVGEPVWTFCHSFLYSKNHIFLAVRVTDCPGNVWQWACCHDEMWFDGEKWVTHSLDAEDGFNPMFWMRLPMPPKEFLP